MGEWRASEPGRPARGARVELLVRARRLPVLRNYPLTRLRRAREARALDLDQVRSFLLFVGHPRSGHSLVGALLDAHPDVLVAHEADVLKYVAAGFGRDELFALLVRVERERVAQGHVQGGTGYRYAVPGQWQGRTRRLLVIGDKKGGRSTMRLDAEPGLLDRLAASVAVPLRVVQVVRNPYDNVATMAIRGPRVPLAAHAQTYLRLAAATDAVRARLAPEQVVQVHLEDLVDDAAKELRRLAAFLDVEPEAGWVDACAGLVFPSARRTRDTVPWTPEVLAAVDAGVARHPWLARYAGAGPSPRPEEGRAG